MPAFSEIDHHVRSHSFPLTIWVPDMTNIRMETCWRMLQRSLNSLHNFLHFLVIEHGHEDESSLKLLMFTI